MKKKLMAVLLGTMMVLSLAACGSSKAAFTDDDLVVKAGSEEVRVALNHYFYMNDEYSEYDNMLDYDDWEEYGTGFATSKGLELGMTMDDYKDLYAVKNGYALWELLDYDDDGYGYISTPAEYTNESARTIYDEYGDKADVAYLDLGWCKEDGKWRAMTDEELYDVWYCEASYSEFGEVAIISVGFDYYDRAAVLYLYHFTYNGDFADWSGWD